ncbi:hypothetical protein HII36_09640 [Nonomuraea sp. NN258]|uniref:hypothetical protein n=1 Tax=Nonomuraea antri TaxID=2730852 RepID=UPI001567E6F0|nr:hypothetical protein [Nonomuraea antri]NRQ32098.1 hypothetical protein [Nonomuraea antri]
MSTLAITGGCLAGLGLALLIAELFPGRPRLDAALARLAGIPLTGHGMPVRLAAFAARFPVPRADLALLGISVERFALQRIGFTALGLLLPMMLNVAAALTGISLPWAVPAIAGLIIGGVFGLFPDIAARSEAAKRRAEFRVALSTYLDMVALERAAGAAPTQALQAPVDICTGWVFLRIAAVLEQARRAGDQPWRGLAELGERMGVSELTDLADIAEDAGTEGAQVLTTLLAKAQSMRTAALTNARAQANARTSDMPIAISSTVIGFLLLVCFPALYRIFAS